MALSGLRTPPPQETNPRVITDAATIAVSWKAKRHRCVSDWRKESERFWTSSNAVIQHNCLPSLGQVPLTRTMCAHFGVCVCKPMPKQKPSRGRQALRFAEKLCSSVFTKGPYTQSERAQMVSQGFIVLTFGVFSKVPGLWGQVQSNGYVCRASSARFP